MFLFRQTDLHCALKLIILLIFIEMSGSRDLCAGRPYAEIDGEIEKIDDEIDRDIWPRSNRFDVRSVGSSGETSTGRDTNFSMVWL